jgi:ATP-dependent DNA ligase
MNYSPQKALHYSEAVKKKNYIPQTFAIQPKLDGWFVYIDYIDGKWGKLSSRAEREIPSLDFLHEHIYKCLSPAENTRFIFEATIPDMQFHELNGVLNRKSESAENVVLNLHDIIFLDRPELPFKDRYEYVNPAYIILKEWLGHWVKLVPILAISSQEDVFYYHFNQVTSSGGEGIILKNYNSGYFFGRRNAHLMKLKELITKDFAVVDLLPGEKGSKYEFTLGALVVQGRNGIKHTVSGMSDDERNLWWSNPDLIKGKVVQVNAMKELPDGSLREGRYKWVRHDKELWEID